MVNPAPKRWHTREDSGIRLDRELRWWHDGERIEHPKIVEAFNRGLRPTDDGRFQLVLGNDWCFVEVEDAAYWVTAVDVSPAQIGARLSDRTEEPLSLDTLVLGEDEVWTCRVKGGRAKARFGRDAQFELGSHLEQSAQGWGLRVAGRWQALPPGAVPR